MKFFYWNLKTTLTSVQKTGNKSHGKTLTESLAVLWLAGLFCICQDLAGLGYIYMHVFGAPLNSAAEMLASAEQTVWIRRREGKGFPSPASTLFKNHWIYPPPS